MSPYEVLPVGSLLVLLLPLVSAAILWWYFSFPLDPAEPPLFASKVPYIGHNIGILAHHAAYYNKLMCGLF